MEVRRLTLALPAWKLLGESVLGLSLWQRRTPPVSFATSDVDRESTAPAVRTVVRSTVFVRKCPVLLSGKPRLIPFHA